MTPEADKNGYSLTDKIFRHIRACKLLKLLKSNRGSVDKRITRFGVKAHICIYSVIHVLGKGMRVP